ncbi:unnamed protein product [Vitrella brassicaformis CCMP3155]|uniref:Uncharacterized protein n=1 Tax=Vitrella brassicaformis (strain CCMP3155) TaxID=1169540 RepID=A0A0G4FW76_VITBC|nr:unnamed protein product [Vitrella brassicaformis CCMP3155]|eukprot:CEM19240.1 unnamed protein product [Vitrella brassicaformis CCMP3155]
MLEFLWLQALTVGLWGSPFKPPFGKQADADASRAWLAGDMVLGVLYHLIRRRQHLQERRREKPPVLLEQIVIILPDDGRQLQQVLIVHPPEPEPEDSVIVQIEPDPPAVQLHAEADHRQWEHAWALSRQWEHYYEAEFRRQDRQDGLAIDSRYA